MKCYELSFVCGIFANSEAHDEEHVAAAVDADADADAFYALEQTIRAYFDHIFWRIFEVDIDGYACGSKKKNVLRNFAPKCVQMFFTTRNFKLEINDYPWCFERVYYRYAKGTCFMRRTLLIKYLKASCTFFVIILLVSFCFIFIP